MSIYEYTFASVAEADTILGEATPWEDAETEDKQEALEYGVIYMRHMYNIPVGQDGDTTNQTLKNANALLANYHLTTSLFLTEQATKPAKGMSKKKVKAADVETETEYDAYLANQYSDPFPEVTAMMNVAGFASKKGAGMRTVPLIRR